MKFSFVQMKQIGTVVAILLIACCNETVSARRATQSKKTTLSQSKKRQKTSSAKPSTSTSQDKNPAQLKAQSSMPTPMPATSSSIPRKKVAMVLPTIKAIPEKAGTQPAHKKRMIVIDPGHGGNDFGTNSHGKPTYHEKYLNLTTCKMLRHYLDRYGYQTIMTRIDDTFISLKNRALFANTQNAKLFVSVHYNSAPSTSAEGVEVFFYRTDGDKCRVAQSKTLAHSVLNKILKHTEAKSRGVKHGNYAVIRETKMPAILVEGGFLSNTAEMDKIKTHTYQKKMALGIAEGIKDYLAKENVLAD